MPKVATENSEVFSFWHRQNLNKNANCRKNWLHREAFLKTGQRLDIIKKICGSLAQSKLSDSNLTLRVFGCETWNSFDCSEYDYYIHRVEELKEDLLIELYEYLFPGETLPVTVAKQSSQLWKDGFVKVFVSHSTKQKLLAAQIKSESEAHGIDCFVAHEDIEPSKEWMREIRYGLATCDCIVTLLTNDFRQSNYCDQEVGFALHRGVLVIPVSIDMDPYGFMAPFQRITAFGSSTPAELAGKIREIISNHEVLADIARKGLVAAQGKLVQKFLSSSNFGDSSSLLRELEDLPEIPVQHLARLFENWEKNDQISGCYGIPKRMQNLFAKHNYKPESDIPF